jgi:hypothetical protein
MARSRGEHGWLQRDDHGSPQMDDEFDLGTAGAFVDTPRRVRSPVAPLRVASAPSSPLTRRAPKIRLPPQELQLVHTDDDPTTPTPTPRSSAFGSDEAGPSSLRRTHSANSIKKGTERSRKNTLTRSVHFPSTVLSADQLAAFRRYALCFALVQFDLDKGPDLDSVFPAYPFTASEKADIAFSSFPDTAAAHSNSVSFTFNWRIPRTDDQAGFLYGYCAFSQQKNERLRRNYLQRSLVLITHCSDLHGLFMTLADHLGALHTKSDHQAAVLLEVACSNIAHWWVE